MFLIGIAGGSGSGKTTFAKKILDKIKDVKALEIVLLSQDSYYLPSPPAHLEVNGEYNFDHPDAFDWELLEKQLFSLKNGEQALVPVYDFKSNQRTKESAIVGPAKTVLLEGIYTLWKSEIRNIFDLKIYLNVEADIRFIRRLHRDIRERERSLDGIIRQYYETVRPMHHEFLEPTRQFADIVVGEETDIAADIVAARISEVIQQ